MASFMLFDQLRAFTGQSGQLLAGGYLKFFLVSDGTTAQDVYGDKGLTVNNGDTITLDSSGRPSASGSPTSIWGDTDNGYFVELYDEDDVKQGEIDNVEVPGGAGQTIPVPDTDEYLSGDGTNFIAVSLAGLLLPDQTGNANKILGTDGTDANWIAKPADGSAGAAGSDIDVAASSFSAADTGTPALAWSVQRGTGTMAASGAHTTSGTITFATEFDSAPFVAVTITSGGVTGDGFYIIPSVTATSTTGATVGGNVNEGGSDGGTLISSTVNFSYIAIGTVTTA